MSQGTAQKGVQPVSGTVELGATSLAALETTELGAATLAALESITVVDGGGSLTVDGSVAVSNFPATQPVSGTVALDVPTLAALETIQIGSMPAVALDAASLAALETIQVGSSALPSNAAQETGGNLATLAAASALAATAANQATELATLGAVSSSPGAYTVMDRLNVLARKLDGVCKAGATEATLQKLLAALKPVPGASAVRATVLHR